MSGFGSRAVRQLPGAPKPVQGAPKGPRSIYPRHIAPVAAPVDAPKFAVKRPGIK